MKKPIGQLPMLMIRIFFAILITLFNYQYVSGQNDPLSLDDVPAESVPLRDAFNGSYIINNQSTNTLQEGRLDFLILHRFGEFSDGAFNAFGMDYAAIRLGFEYGLTDKLTAAIGRSSVGKNYDAHLKYRPIVQTQGGVSNTPASVVLFSSVAFSSTELRKQNDIQTESQFANQLVYTTQAMISRQFSRKLSLQLATAYIHRNTVISDLYNHNIVAVSTGVRFKVSERMHLTTDYSYVFNKDEDTKLYNPLALGLEIVTGGHIFQVYLTNSVGMIEKEFLTATTGNLQDADIRLGFTVSRAFMLKHEVKGGKLK